jgi:hypothetical protein
VPSGRKRPRDAWEALPFTRFHNGSHRHLLDEWVDTNFEAPVDAIIVPTARPVHCLRDTMTLAKKLGCLLLTLCSREASARQTADLGTEMNARVVAIDVLRAPAMPPKATDRLLQAEGLAGTSDLSLKRNIGLILGKVLGWKRTLFLDDDICDVDPRGVTRAAALLSSYRAVGLRNDGFPDNSVVCHALRKVGGPQKTFIGGGAMLVAPERTSSFFPNIYNEDWFFLLGGGVPFRVAEAGTARQRPYNPFAAPARAAGEEFGDTLAEGLFSLLDEGKTLSSAATAAFWGDFLFKRRLLLDDILRRAEHRVVDPALRSRICTSVQAAKRASSFLRAQVCQEFVDAWTGDVDRWEDYVKVLPRHDDVEKALADFGLLAATYRSTLALQRHTEGTGTATDEMATSAQLSLNVSSDHVQGSQTSVSTDHIQASALLARP